jgi:2-dehydro-3-deoxyphosphogluconate aldolase / (4S)-4-hydroxy-2-oxoglutarate aldolase
MNSNPDTAQRTLRDTCTLAPVMVVRDAAQAAPLARTLISGGLPALGVTQPTPAALDVIAAMSKIAGGVTGAVPLERGLPLRPGGPCRCV